MYISLEGTCSSVWTWPPLACPDAAQLQKMAQHGKNCLIKRFWVVPNCELNIYLRGQSDSSDCSPGDQRVMGLLDGAFGDLIWKSQDRFVHQQTRNGVTFHLELLIWNDAKLFNSFIKKIDFIAKKIVFGHPVRSRRPCARSHTPDFAGTIPI